MLAEGCRVNGVQQLRGQKGVQVLRQITPANIFHLADVGLQNEILGIGGKFPELFQEGQTIGRLLDSGQKGSGPRERAAKARSAAFCSAGLPSWGSIAFRSFREISDLLFAIHALLPFGELQLEADILPAGIIQHHHRVIGGALLFRPHSLDGEM